MPCAEAVEALHTDLLFCSVSAVSPTHAFHQEEEIVLVKRAMLRAARTKVLLVDHAKLQRTALHRLAPLSDFDVVVVDEKTPEELIRPLRDHGVTVEVATF
jgi:DeoR/GlpR family transcriptional regulator of sugar metabolism